MPSMADEIFGALVLAGSERSAQARYDKEAFAREKRGYAARLRVALSYLRETGVRIDAADAALVDLIAELEGE